MITSQAMRKYARELYENATLFSPEESVGDRILYLCAHEHNTESVVAWLRVDVAKAAITGDEKDRPALRAAINFLETGK
jgi:hypothetical protein